jgi:hypothetical protein
MRKSTVICDVCRRQLEPAEEVGTVQLMLGVVLVAPPFDLCGSCIHQLKSKLEDGRVT